MLSYAADTSVSVERSRAEIETILGRYGASRFGYMMDDQQATIVFEAHGRAVKFHLPLPQKDAYRQKLRRGYKVNVSAEDQHKNWEQACRSKWRSLNLCIKAKLEAVAAGITTFETEFLAHFVIGPRGETIGDRVLPQLMAIPPGGKLNLMLTDSSHEK